MPIAPRRSNEDKKQNLSLRPFLHDAHICRTDYFIHAYQLLNAVRAPTDYSRNGEHRSIKLLRYAQHIINKAAVKVHIRADPLVNMAVLCDKLGCKLLHVFIQLQILLPALLGSEPINISFEDPLARV